MVCQKHSLKSTLLLLLAYFFQLINAPTAWSNPADPVSIATQVDITQPTLGDILTYSITVNHDSDIVIHNLNTLYPKGLKKLDTAKRILEK